MSASKPNLLFLPKWYPHDESLFDGNFIRNHAEAISRVAKIKVIFVHSSYDDSQKHKYVHHQLDHKGIQEMRIYFKRANTGLRILDKLINSSRYRKAQLKAYDLMYQDEQPDLVHIHVLARSAMLALRLLRKKSIPFVITEHWSGYLPQSGALKSSRKTGYYRHIANKARAIHTVTNNLAKAMQSHGIINDFTVIPNVVNTEIFKYQDEDEDEDEEEVFDSNVSTSEQDLAGKPDKSSGNSQLLNILFVGNLLQHPKRILDVVQCFAEIEEQRSDFSLHIYGEGEDEASVRALIDELGLENHIQLRGTTDQTGIAGAMQGADFLFLFSEFESQPCVINEALCCGTPVVVPDIEGIVEFMKDEFGLIFPRLNKKAFVKSIIQMMNEHGQYQRQAIAQKAAERFGEESIAQEFNDFYQKALTKS